MCKSMSTPKLIESFLSRGGHRQVQVWNTSCAVTNAGKTSIMACTVLINPANPQLSGVSKFPYFPRGGPSPKVIDHSMGHASQWGGMDVGSGMLFAAHVVDGVVHRLGGGPLARECDQVPPVITHDILTHPGGDDDEVLVRCPVSEAVITGPGQGTDLTRHFDHIVHTVPPFYRHHPEPKRHLIQCYRKAL